MLIYSVRRLLSREIDKFGIFCQITRYNPRARPVTIMCRQRNWTDGTYLVYTAGRRRGRREARRDRPRPGEAAGGRSHQVQVVDAAAGAVHGARNGHTVVRHRGASSAAAPAAVGVIETAQLRLRFRIVPVNVKSNAALAVHRLQFALYSLAQPSYSSWKSYLRRRLTTGRSLS